MKIAIYLLVSINEICCLEYYCDTVSPCYAVTRLSVYCIMVLPIVVTAVVN